MTYREIYEKGYKLLQAAGVEEAALDARLLLEAVCNTNRNDLLVHGERLVATEDEERYQAMLAKRAQRIPLQHITGIQEFMGLEFQVNEHVLIPRQDTEILVEEVLRELHDGMRILDMCTGSGCILLSLLHYSNDCQGVGVDISEDALQVARANAVRILGEAAVKAFGEDSAKVADDKELSGENSASTGEKVFCENVAGCSECAAEYPNENTVGSAKVVVKSLGEDIADNVGMVHFLQSDLFEKVTGKYEFIVSNPPYIQSAVIETLMPEVKDYEPRLALDGCEDGLFFYRKIVKESRNYLTKGGMLYFEIGYDQAEAVSRLMEEAGFVEIKVVKDYAGLDRVVYGTYV